MYSLIFLAPISFLLSFILTPIIRDAFIRLGVLDHPDDKRKNHATAVPRVGGIAIAISYVGAYALLLLSPFRAAWLIEENLGLVWKFFPSVSFVFFIGLFDDFFGLRPLQKLTGQVAAALLAYWAGVRILGVAGSHTENWWSLPLTVLWLVGCSNAFNLIDGLDGLASGIGLFATLATLIAAFLQGHVELAIATMPLAGALLGFLRYNFNPASIFLGDSGSLLIGFLLGCYSVTWSSKSVTLIGMTAPLMALALPLLDTSLSIIRRFLQLKPILGADRGHIHHRLLDRGFTPRIVTFVLYGACGLAAFLSLLQGVIYKQFAGVISVLFCIFAWLGIKSLGYAEFGEMRRMLMGGSFRRMLNARLCLRRFEQSLAGATTMEKAWVVLRDACKDFGFTGLRLQAGGEIYEIKTASEDEGWYLRISLSATAYISFTRPFNSPTMAMIVPSFVDVVRRELRPKLGASADTEAGARYSAVLPWDREVCDSTRGIPI